MIDALLIGKTLYDYFTKSETPKVEVINFDKGEVVVVRQSKTKAKHKKTPKKHGEFVPKWARDLEVTVSGGTKSKSTQTLASHPNLRLYGKAIDHVIAHSRPLSGLRNTSAKKGRVVRLPAVHVTAKLPKKAKAEARKGKKVPQFDSAGFRQMAQEARIHRELAFQDREALKKAGPALKMTRRIAIEDRSQLDIPGIRGTVLSPAGTQIVGFLRNDNAQFPEKRSESSVDKKVNRDLEAAFAVLEEHVPSPKPEEVLDVRVNALVADILVEDEKDSKKLTSLKSEAKKSIDDELLDLIEDLGKEGAATGEEIKAGIEERRRAREIDTAVGELTTEDGRHMVASSK